MLFSLFLCQSGVNGGGGGERAGAPLPAFISCCAIWKKDTANLIYFRNRYFIVFDKVTHKNVIKLFKMVYILYAFPRSVTWDI